MLIRVVWCVGVQGLGAGSGGEDLRGLLEQVMGHKGMADLALGEGLVLRADGTVYSTKHG